MKYYVTIEDREHEIAIDHHGLVTIDGIELPADMRSVGGANLYSLMIEHDSYEVVIESDTDQRNVYGVMVAGQRYAVKVQDERSRRLAVADRTMKAPSGDLAIKAPIPGLVVKIPIAPGQHVEEGDSLIILEAMKMENELRSPRAGIVHDIRVTSGSQVALGQVLLTLK